MGMITFYCQRNISVLQKRESMIVPYFPVVIPLPYPFASRLKDTLFLETLHATFFPSIDLWDAKRLFPFNFLLLMFFVSIIFDLKPFAFCPHFFHFHFFLSHFFVFFFLYSPFRLFFFTIYSSCCFLFPICMFLPLIFILRFYLLHSFSLEHQMFTFSGNHLLFHLFYKRNPKQI